MSHCPGVFLEDLITDLFRVVDKGGEHGTGIRRLYFNQLILSKEQFGEIVNKLEPYREEIEDKLLNYDEVDHGSWRDYKGLVVVNLIPNEVYDEVWEYLKSIYDQVEKTKGL